MVCGGRSASRPWINTRSILALGDGSEIESVIAASLVVPCVRDHEVRRDPRLFHRPHQSAHLQSHDPRDTTAMDIQDLLDWARNRNPVVALTAFCLVNILGTSVLSAADRRLDDDPRRILYGQVGGLTIYLSTCVVGAWITFGVVRLLRDRLLSLLKPEHLEIWHKLDAAITREGLWICFYGASRRLRPLS